MKLIILAAIVGVCSAARLEHLERGYLPPNQGSGQSTFGSNGNGFGSSGSHGSGFGGNVGLNGRSGAFHSGASLSPAQLKQYLPPDHGPSGGNFGSSFAHSGSLGGSPSSLNFGSQRASFGTPSQKYGAPAQQFQPASHGPSGSFGSFGNQGGQFGSSGLHGSSGNFDGHFGASAQSRQYLAPKQTSRFQNIPQQAFDERTGYQY